MGPSPVLAPAGGPAGVLPLPLPDPLGVIGSGLGSAVKGLLHVLVGDFLRQLAGPVLRYVLHTPDLLAEATLRRLWGTALAATTVLAVLLVAVAGCAVITGASTRWGLAAREAVGTRLVTGLLTAAVSLPLVALEADLANRLVDALTTTGISGATDPLTGALVAHLSGDAGSSLALLVTTLVGVVYLAVLAVLGLARWAALWLLVVLAPFAMAVGLLPSGGPVVRAWWRLQATAVFLPVAHAVLVATYLALFGSDRTGFVGALGGVATLAVMAKLPGWAAGAAGGADGAELVTHTRRAARTAMRWGARSGPLPVSAAAAAGARTAGRAAARVAPPPTTGGRGRGATP